MYFDRVFITAEGYDLLGAATAGSQGQQNTTIIWENAITSSVDISGWTQTEINGATSGDFPTDAHTSSGAVTSAVHSQKDVIVDNQTIKVDVVTVTVDINNNQYNGIANTLCVFARLDGGERKLVIIASADNPETVHPKESQPYNAIIDLYIELSGTAVSEVSTDQSWYASADAFNKIANRVVTTHSEDSPTVGEDQDIYGVKTFKDNMYTSSVIPSSNFTVDLGDTEHNYRSVSARTVNQFTLRCVTTDSQAEKIVISAAAQNFSEPTAGDRILVKFTSGNSSAVPTIKINNGETYAINGLRTNLEGDSVVPMTFNGSSWDVDGVSSVANQVNVALNSEASDYSLVFTNTATRQLLNVPISRELYIDPNTEGTLKYNPSTNTLTCATFAGEATQLSESPVLNFTDATDSSNSTLTVEVGGKVSQRAVISTVLQSYNTFIKVADDSTEYKIPFTQFSSSNSFRTLYTDDNTSSSLKYNPNTNTLSANTLKCASLNVSGSFDLSPEAMITFVKQLGIDLALIDIYRAASGGGESFDFQAGDEIEFGTGASASIPSRDYTICVSGSKTSYLVGSFRITKLISSGITSSVQNSIDITTGGTTYYGCSNPNYGTPCVCLAVRV